MCMHVRVRIHPPHPTPTHRGEEGKSKEGKYISTDFHTETQDPTTSIAL